MLVVYRRHEKGCQFTKRDERRCRCGIWIDWHVAGKRIRKPLGIRDWQAAQQRVRDIEAEGLIEGRVAPTIEEACRKFLSDAQARRLRDGTLYKYRLLFRQLQEFCVEHGYVFISDFDLERTSSFRESWTNKGVAARKKLEALRTFFEFCLRRHWVKENYAKQIKPPKNTNPPVLPFSPEEIKQIMKALPEYPKANRTRIRALVLLLRYSGLRLTDAVTLSRQKIQDGKLHLRTGKTGTPIYHPLPPSVLDALDQCPGQHYFFWTGSSKPKSAVGDWQRALRRLFILAGVPTGHAHRFRHTFAVNLLAGGVSMEQVASLLGHSSIRITERHYAAWDQRRQTQLEDSIRRIWDPEDLKITVTSTAHQMSNIKKHQ